MPEPTSQTTTQAPAAMVAAYRLAALDFFNARQRDDEDAATRFSFVADAIADAYPNVPQQAKDVP